VDELQEFAMSSNGDRWFLERGAAGQSVVLHKGNPASGGHETRTSVEAFLAKTAASPEREALLAILDVNASPGTLADRDVDKTPSLILAEEYLRLGGRRLAKVETTSSARGSGTMSLRKQRHFGKTRSSRWMKSSGGRSSFIFLRSATSDPLPDGGVGDHDDEPRLHQGN
jgi:hypothetical protein